MFFFDIVNGVWHPPSKAVAATAFEGGGVPHPINLLSKFTNHSVFGTSIGLIASSCHTGSLEQNAPLLKKFWLFQ